MSMTVLHFVAVTAALRAFPVSAPTHGRAASILRRSRVLVAQELQTPPPPPSSQGLDLERIEIRDDTRGVAVAPATFEALGVSADLVVTNLAAANITTPNARPLVNSVTSDKVATCLGIATTKRKVHKAPNPMEYEHNTTS